MLTISATAANTEVPTATFIDGQLTVKGTQRDDVLLIAAVNGGTQVRVRGNRRLPGTFELPAGIAIAAFSGRDYIYVADSLIVPAISTDPNDAQLGLAADIILAPTNPPLPRPRPAGSGGEFVPQAASGLSPHELAILQVLDQWSNEDRETWKIGSSGRRR